MIPAPLEFYLTDEEREAISEQEARDLGKLTIKLSLKLMQPTGNPPRRVTYYQLPDEEEG